MSYRFKRGETVRDGVQRIAIEEIESALATLDDGQMDRHEVVHDVRKSCKKLRGLLRLVRPQCEETYQVENAQFRDAARKLSDIRDAESVCESLDALIDRFGGQVHEAAFEATWKTLRSRKREISQECHDLDDRLAEFRSALDAARERVPSWPFDDRGFSGIAGGLKKTYGRGRDAMQAAYDEPEFERFHDWRKRVKYHWYHNRLLRNAWKPMFRARTDQLKNLSDSLGDLHDLANLRKTLLANPGRYGSQEELQALFGLIESRSAEFAGRARRLGDRLFAEKPKPLVRRFRRYWKVWHQKREAPANVVPARMPTVT